MVASLGGFVNAEEVIQRKKIVAAHKTLQRAIEEKELFEGLLEALELDEKNFLDESEKVHSSDEEMTRWKLSVFHDYVEKCLEDAEARIQEAQTKEFKSRRSLKELDHWEREIEDIFVELDIMRQQRELELFDEELNADE